MNDTKSAFERLESLCTKLGKLLHQQEIVIWDDDISEETLLECKHSLVGKLLQNPSINVQALQSAMQKAWRNTFVVVKPLENDLYSFLFRNEDEKLKVLDGGPWCFSNHLLLKNWEPDQPPHYYVFDSCLFWVRIFGLPLEWKSSGIVEKIARTMGKVVEVKIEDKGPVAQRVGKAKVELDINAELRVGHSSTHKGRKVWLDFKYERLPFFCYSCGKMGHHASFYKVIPSDEANFHKKGERCFGNWLRAEVKEKSPFWDVFYQDSLETGEALVDEIIPDTQEAQTQLIVRDMAQTSNPLLSHNPQPQPVTPQMNLHICARPPIQDAATVSNDSIPLAHPVQGQNPTGKKDIALQQVINNC